MSNQDCLACNIQNRFTRLAHHHSAQPAPPPPPPIGIETIKKQLREQMRTELSEARAKAEEARRQVHHHVQPRKVKEIKTTEQLKSAEDISQGCKDCMWMNQNVWFPMAGAAFMLGVIKWRCKTLGMLLGAVTAKQIANRHYNNRGCWAELYECCDDCPRPERIERKGMDA
eukprot:TRINITY_DN75554_c0_g1_i1.p2 TRINITY_DN75554_c0_g1~~TRINITY_DN75554_c0_g1_i1.p2  ORF type:complete len:196 (+),score=18.82 TRINITY_DN75554_c0_g1_i1:77-589(+)